MPRRCLISVARNLPREKILRLTGLFPQNGSKFHSGNDDNSVFFHKGNGVFFQRPFKNLPGVPRYGGIGHARDYVWTLYVHTCFYTLLYTFIMRLGDILSQRQNVPLHYAPPQRHNVPTYGTSPATFCPTFSIWIPTPRAKLARISGISGIYLGQFLAISLAYI